MNTVIFSASNQCANKIGVGDWYDTCQVARQQVAINPVSSTTNLTIKQLAFVNELDYVFVGTIVPKRNAQITLSSDAQVQYTLQPTAAPSTQTIRMPVSYGSTQTGIFTFLFPDDGVANSNIVVSKETSLTLVSNITTADTGSLSAYISALIDHYKAMVAAVAAVTASDVSWQDLVAAANKAAGVLASVEQFPGITDLQRDTISDAQVTLNQSVQAVQMACGTGGQNECSQQQANAIVAMQALLTNVQSEIDTAEQFLTDEITRLQQLASDLATTLKQILGQIQNAQNSSNQPLVSFANLIPSLYPGFVFDEQQRLVLRLGFSLNENSRHSITKQHLTASSRVFSGIGFLPIESYGEETITLTSDDLQPYVSNPSLTSNIIIKDVNTFSYPGLARTDCFNVSVQPFAAPGNLIQTGTPPEAEPGPIPGVMSLYFSLRSPTDIQNSPDLEYKITIEFQWREIWLAGFAGSGLTLSVLGVDPLLNTSIAPTNICASQADSATSTDWVSKSLALVGRFTRENILKGNSYQSLCICVRFIGIGAFQFGQLIYEIEQYE